MGHFEAERSQVEIPAEELPRDFGQLIAEVRECPREAAQPRLSYWIEWFQEEWTNGSDQWGLLVDLLPRPRDFEPSIAQFRKHLLSATREPSAADVFLAHPLIVSKLSSYAWTDFLGSHAAGFVAGCLNVARAAAQSGSPSSTVMGTLSNAVANYALTLIGIALHDPEIVRPTEDGCALADALDVPRERFERWSFEKCEQELQGLLTTFDVDKVLQVVRLLHGQTQLSEAIVAPMIKTVLDLTEEPKATALIATFAFEHPEISASLRERCLKATGSARADALGLWARYVALPDAFTFCWECVRPGTAEAPAPLGDTLDERLKKFEGLIRMPRTPSDLPPAPPASDWHWREPALRMMAGIGSLAAKKWTDREDRLVCEDDVTAAFAACPELLAPAINGILDLCRASWDVLDPVMLRLPADQIVPVLTDYAARASVWADSRHHAARLLAQAKGEAVAAVAEGAEGDAVAAEALPEPARQRKPMASQTWIGEGSLERLWHVALEVAQTRYDECMVKRYAEEKDEHCAALGDIVARSLNGTNSALKMWLRSNGSGGPTLRATVRRPAATKSKRATGGLQPDLAILFRCKVAGKCVTKRITPLRAKKLGIPSNGTKAWPSEFKVQGGERTQLTRLLTLSSSTHYLFILPGEVGETLRVLPAALVRDMLASQGFGGGIPVQTVLQAGIRLPEFILFHVLGLWTGDDDKDLIAKAEDETEVDQAPHVTLEISISKD